MGCSSSKRIEAAADIYRPAPASFAVFDIHSIREPWLTVDNTLQERQEKPRHVPAPILEKLSKFETDAPHSWDEVSYEVSKALEDLKPSINNKGTVAAVVAVAASPPKVAHVSTPMQKLNQPHKSVSFHTLEEFDEKLSAKPAKDLRKTASVRIDTKETIELKESKSLAEVETITEKVEGFKSVKENIFIVRDRMEREKEGRQANFYKFRRDPLSDFPEKCPPGGSDSVVIYTTSLRGVRRTFEDCCQVRSIFEVKMVVTDERDVSLHGEFLNELKDLLGEGVSVPRVFVKGRYIGGADELNELNESGKLERILRSARVETGIGRQACEGCGGARFVPCLDCGGSCKVFVNGARERCGKCNENGLVHCPACLQW